MSRISAPAPEHAPDSPAAASVLETDGPLHRIVIVGGGAGGLELACRLGRKMARPGKAHVTLIDPSTTHVWKPLLHEVAAGVLGAGSEEADYLSLSRRHGFHFRLGRMVGLDRARKVVEVAPTLDEAGQEIIPRRFFPYDTLVLAVGGVTPDFGIPGVREHTFRLDSLEEARAFHRRLLHACLRVETQTDPVRQGQLDIVIVGTGATGVELAAALHEAIRDLAGLGLERLDPDRSVRLVLVGATDRILPGLPDSLAAAVHQELAGLGVDVINGELVVEVSPQGVRTRSGRFLPSDLVVWAGGVKGPAFLKDLDGLESNRMDQLLVTATLQTTRDPDIFALGDCAWCPQPNGDAVPPRAQAAHQQATLLAESLVRRLKGKGLRAYRYRDFGSLISLGKYSTIGNLMGGVVKGSLFVAGRFARLVYWSLHKMHQVVLSGVLQTVLSTVADRLARRHRPPVKLH